MVVVADPRVGPKPFQGAGFTVGKCQEIIMVQYLFCVCVCVKSRRGLVCPTTLTRRTTGKCPALMRDMRVSNEYVAFQLLPQAFVLPSSDLPKA